MNPLRVAIALVAAALAAGPAYAASTLYTFPNLNVT